MQRYMMDSRLFALLLAGAVRPSQLPGGVYVAVEAQYAQLVALPDAYLRGQLRTLFKSVAQAQIRTPAVDVSVRWGESSWPVKAGEDRLGAPTALPSGPEADAWQRQREDGAIVEAAVRHDCLVLTADRPATDAINEAQPGRAVTLRMMRPGDRHLRPARGS